MVDIKDVNLKQIIRISSAECTCFIKFKDMIICGYGDTSGCSFWSNGIAGSKDTKFIIIKKMEKIMNIIILKMNFIIMELLMLY